MYRDDPLDDEVELRELAGDHAVDRLAAARDAVGQDLGAVACDVLRVLQGWVDDAAAARWFTSPQRRLEDRTPVDALAGGAVEEGEDAARAWAAANS
jgi:uncharacterized protein (DUF2384 family)